MENHRPWSDLPHPLLDQILDRLPLPHYIRFSAVCPRWRSVQVDHCCRGPIVSYPLLIPSYLKQLEDHQEDSVIVPCYSPFERRIYNIRNLPISSPLHFCRASSSHGWILLQQLYYPKDTDPSEIGIIGRTRNGRKKILKQIQKRRNWPPPLPDDILSFYFLNPILNIRISLPPLQLSSSSVDHVAISGSSACTALVVIRRRLFLFRTGHRYWFTLPFPPGLSIRKVKSCGEKFYCICSYSSIVVIDPRRHPTSIEHFEMDVSLAPYILFEPSDDILLESGGQLLLVRVSFNFREKYEMKGFRVFKADLSNKMWEPMECLGDRMLLLACNSSVSLLADAIGGRRNCIYYSKGSIWSSICCYAEESAWKIFDLGSQSITNWPLLDTLSEGDCLKIKRNAWRLI